MITLLLIGVGVIVTQTLVLNLEFHHKAKGYLVRATTWIWSTLMLIVLLETAITTILIEVTAASVPLLKLYPLPFLWGVLAVLLPRGFEEIVLYRNPSEKKTTNPLSRTVKRIIDTLARMLRRLNLAATNEFAGAIRTRMEQDVFDWQTQSERHFDLSPEQFRRRIRQVYYCHVIEMATLRRDPTLLRRDAGFSPYGHLYLLAGHLGRKRLIQELKTVNLKWPGDEKRKRTGKIDDRAEPSGEIRFYDNEDLIKRIQRGQKTKGSTWQRRLE